MDHFIVSARKYRPATFVSVVGQSHITSTLKNAILRGQLAHAYLFCGPRGVGKTTCARIFAKTINCLSPNDGEACDQCESCKAFNESRSFNIHELDAASNNSVDDIRSLTDQVRIPPQIGQYSVYIIDEVHMLSLQAFNAFLKTLEEPPAHAVFILATTEKHKIIPTILSRCQIYDFNRIKVEDSVGYLKHIAGQENVAFDDESLHLIARKADGGMRDALSMFDKVVSFCGPNLTVSEVSATLNVLDYDTYFNVTDHILSGDYTSALLVFDEVLKKGFSAQTFVAGLNAHFRDLLMCKNPQTVPLLEVTGTTAQKYKDQAARCEIPLLVEGINLLTGIDSGLRTATSQRLNVELGLMKLSGLGQKKNNGIGEAPELPELRKQVVSDPKAASPKEQSSERPKSTEPETVSDRPIESRVEKSVKAGEPDREKQAELSPETPIISPGTSSGEGIEPVKTRSDTKKEASQPQRQVDTRSQVVPPESPLSISGRSISAILNGTTHSQAEEEESQDPDPEEDIAIDEQTEARLLQACEAFAKEVNTTRPRISIIFSEARVNDNIISLKVPNESTNNELSASLTDIQRRLLELSGVRIQLKFDITVHADTAGLKPMKIEDRMRHLTEKNPLLNELRSALNLDTE